MPASHKYSTIRFGLGAAVLAALVLTLAACSRPPAPMPQLVEVAQWWETSPETQLNRYAQVEIEASFKNVSSATLTFLGDSGANQPEDDIQIWTAPNLEHMPVAFAEFPLGDYAPDAEMTWKMTLDLSGLASTEKKIGIRPAPSAHGTLTPGTIEMTTATVTWTR